MLAALLVCGEAARLSDLFSGCGGEDIQPTLFICLLGVDIHASKIE